MATKKIKKTKPTAKPAAKKTAVKAVKAIKAVKVSKPKKSAKVKHESFKVSRETSAFKTFKITEQTIMWSILLVYVLLLSLWILKLQMDTLLIIDRIEATL